MFGQWLVESLPAFFTARLINEILSKPGNPIIIGNAGLVSELPTSKACIQSLSVAFHNIIKGLYVAVVTLKGDMCLTFCSTSVLNTPQLEGVADKCLDILKVVATTEK